MMTVRSRALAALVVSSALALAGCGGAASSGQTANTAAAPSALSTTAAPTFTSSAAETSAPPLPDSQRWHPVGHLAPASGWAGDPSGLVYENGTYHAFYLHNPSGVESDGALEWAHATSPDLLTWTEQPVAIPAGDEQILSGSVVFDQDNTSGLGTADEPPLVAISTVGSAESPEQSLAYSTDHGITWQQYEDNPVLSTDGLTDPSVTWYADGGYWLLTGALGEDHAVAFYRSSNLTDWRSLGEFTGFGVQSGNWENPALFPLALDGNADDTRWVLTVGTPGGGVTGGSGTQYFVGSFDGGSFTPDPLGPAGVGAIQPGEMHSWMDWGPDLIGVATVNNAPDGRTIAIGRLGNEAYADVVPTTDWRGSLSLPRELTLSTVDGVPRLMSAVPAEVSAAIAATTPVFTDDEIDISNGNRKLDSDASGTNLVVQATLTPGTAAVAGFTVLGSSTGQRATRIQYVSETGILQLDRTTSGQTGFSAEFSPGAAVAVPLTDGSLDLRIIVDGSSVEVFAGGGQAVLSALAFPAAEDDNVGVFAGGGKATISKISVTPLGA
jgi:fructan beta-fructosidase